MKLWFLGLRTAVIVAPHSDDETIGAFNLIRALHRAGVRVRVLIVSDGAASHPGSLRWPSARLVAERRCETRRAMARAGLSASRVTYLDLPDGGLAALGARAWRPLARALRQCCAPGLIVGPSLVDAHPDHVAVASALAHVDVPHARQLAYRVWPVDPARARRRLGGMRVPGNALAKRSVLRLYRTQTGTITDSATGFTMSRAERARFTKPCEWFDAR